MPSSKLQGRDRPRAARRRATSRPTPSRAATRPIDELTVTLKYADRPRARDPGHQAHLEARPAHLRQATACRRCSAAWASRSCPPRRRDHQPRGRGARHRRRGALLRLVACHEPHRKKPIALPAGVEVDGRAGARDRQGPEGRARAGRPARDHGRVDDGVVDVTRPTDRGPHRALHGLTRTLVANMVEGVTDGFEKRLEIQGVGYRAALKGSSIEFALGFSHPVTVEPPDGHRVRGARADAGRRARHRQAGRRPGRGEDPQAAAAGALQGQGHPLPGRVRPPQGRQAR